MRVLRFTTIAKVLVLCGIGFLTISLHSMITKGRSSENIDYGPGSALKVFSLCRMPSVELVSECPGIELQKPKLVSCGSEKDWVDVKDGQLYINKEVSAAHKGVSCTYEPIIRETEFKIVAGKEISVTKSPHPLSHEFLRVKCKASDGATYMSHQWNMVETKEMKSRPQKPSSRAMSYNIAMLGYDSVSRTQFMKYAPKTYDYFKEIGGVILQGYNIAGDGTPENLLPILTGKTELELPEARKRIMGSKPVDGHPWVWKNFSAAGYLTQFMEEMSEISAFTYRMHGFTKVPVDFFSRPIEMDIDANLGKHKDFCNGATPRTKLFPKWIKNALQLAPDKLKFLFGFQAEYTHDGNERSKFAGSDPDMKAYVEDLNRSGLLDKTIFILMADHGPRYSTSRVCLQGKLDERLPFFGIRLPPDFKNKHPVAYENFLSNAKVLTTPFDIHETFHQVLDYNPDREYSLEKDRGMSLFHKISENRTCSQAGIMDHFCACQNRVSVLLTSGEASNAATAVIDGINAMTAVKRSECQEMEFKSIRSVFRLVSNEKMLRFRQTKDVDGRIPDFSDNVKFAKISYQVTLITSPGEGIYEATVYYDMDKKKFGFDGKTISRLNRYGHQTKCLGKDWPHIEKFCFCKNLLGPDGNEQVVNEEIVTKKGEVVVNQ